MQNARLDEAQARIKIAGRNTSNLRYAEDTILMAQSKEEGEGGEWKSWIKTQHSKNKDQGIWSHHFMGTRWVKIGNSDRLYFLGLQNHWRQWLQPWN